MQIKDIALIVFAVAAIVALIILYRKNIVTEQYMADLDSYLDKIDDGDGLVALLARYAGTAVRAVEQMVKAGIIPKENEARKKCAEEMVVNMAEADGVELSEADMVAADAIIEAEVYSLEYE